MGTFHANINLSYTDTGTGLIDSKFNFAQLITQIETATIDTIFITGQREALTTDIRPKENKILKAYTGEEPFRLKVRSFYDEDCTTEALKFIFQGPSVIEVTGDCYFTKQWSIVGLISTQFKCNHWVHRAWGAIHTGSLNLLCSTFVADVLTPTYQQHVIGYDSLMDIGICNTSIWNAQYGKSFWNFGADWQHAGWLGNSAVSFDSSKMWVPGEFPDCQANWVPPVWPAWDAPLSAFNYLTLPSGITVLPQPAPHIFNQIDPLNRGLIDTWSCTRGYDYTLGLKGDHAGKGIGALNYDIARTNIASRKLLKLNFFNL